MQTHTQFGPNMPSAFRLGLATRGNTHPQCEDVMLAFEHGVNYWNWCGHEDGMSQAIRQLGVRRGEVIVATQLSDSNWSRDGMRREIEAALSALNCDWLDIVTLYYVESESEWRQIIAEDGAYRALVEAKEQGVVRSIGLTTHQRRLAAKWVQTGRLDMLMIRYNAAHRGAESEIFPLTDALDMPVVCFTCLRWGALLKSTDDDPFGFKVPPAAEWYRFVLSHPSVGVALMAPNHRNELLENLHLLKNWSALPALYRKRLSAHGDRVRDAAGPFP